MSLVSGKMAEWFCRKLPLMAKDSPHGPRCIPAFWRVGQSGAIVTDSHGESWIVRGDSHGPSSASGVWRTVTYGRRQASGSAEVNPTSPLPPARPLGFFWALSLVLCFAFGPASSCLALRMLMSKDRHFARVLVHRGMLGWQLVYTDTRPAFLLLFPWSRSYRQ